MKGKVWVVLLLSLPLLLLASQWGNFAYPFQSDYSDLTISHTPNLLFLRQSLAQTGEVPLWSNSILSGYPFAANPLSGLWYPPAWAAVFLPIPWGLNILIWLHLLWGGIGLYSYLRTLGLHPWPALLGGISFELMPKLLAHLAAGHVSLVFAVAWTPWLLLVERRRIAGPPPQGGAPLLSGLVYGAILLADVRWAAFCLVLWWLYSLYERMGLEPRKPAALLRWGGAMLAQTGVGLLVAAPLLLPLLQYTQLSTRSLMGSADQLAFSLPPMHLFGLLFPDMGGYAEWSLYPGAISLLMFAWVAGKAGLKRRYAFWIGVVMVALVFSLGEAIPPIGWITRLPGFHLLRVPARALFLAGLGFSVVLAAGADDLLRLRPGEEAKQRFGPGLAPVSIAAFAGLFAAGAYSVTRQASAEFLWGAGFLLVFTGLMLLRQRGALSPGAWMAALFPLLVLDMGGVGYTQFTFRAPEQVLAESQAAARYLSSRPGIFRVYSPSYSLHQQTAAYYGLQLADGIDPLQLLDYTKFMAAAGDIPVDGYSVTLPPFQSSDLAKEHRFARPDAQQMGLLNVKYLAAEFPVQAQGWRLVERFGETHIYENERWLPRAWVQQEQAQPGQGVVSVPAVAMRPNRVSVQAEGPGLLVLAEIDYPGWRVYIDGKSAEIVRVGGVLRGVRLSEGPHQALFSFRPAAVYLGMALAGLTWLVVLVRAVILRRR